MDWRALGARVLATCESVAWKLIAAGLLLLLGKLIIRTVIRRMEKSRLAKRSDKTVHRFIVSLVKVSSYVFLAISVVAILGVPLASIITVLGSAGVAISLAVQGTLGNLASGVMLLVFKPFVCGDYIQSGDYSGIVSEIGIFYTTIIAFDNTTVVIPNSSLTGSAVSNFSKQNTRRLDISLSLSYGIDPEAIKRTVKEILSRHADILDNPEPTIRLTEMQDSWVSMTLKVWTGWDHYWDLKFDLQEEIYRRFGELGISFQFPVVEVHMKEEEKTPSENK